MLTPFARRIWPTRLLLRYVVVAVIFTFLVGNLVILQRRGYIRRIFPQSTTSYLQFPLDGDDNSHPIVVLIHEARRKQAELLAKRSTSLKEAAERYRERRGRHPPPGFDLWMAHALDHDAIIVEEFWDRIYHDLTPFWALDSNVLRERANSWHHVVRVRDGKATGDGNTEGYVPWLQHWTALVEEMAPYLPDVDMPINYMDESRLLVPHETVAKYVAKERTMRRIVPIEKVLTKHKTGLAAVDAARKEAYDPQWMRDDSRRYWDYTRVTCPPGSPSRDVPAMTDFALPPSIPYNWHPDHAYEGYVRNFTASMDPCTQPHLRAMHGTFIEPISISTSTELVPLFGGSKLPNNNEILIPGAMYLTTDPFYSGGDTHGPPWAEKRDRLVWRGVASGGRNHENNWMHFHRHRLVEMLNGTTVAGMEANGVRAMTFDMPPVERYPFARRRENRIGAWLRDFADAGFNKLLCFPDETRCDYLAKYFGPRESVPMAEQYQCKFLPDADGNSFSARFRGFMLSTSLPLKATIYAEWHDSRLVPWLHFAPLDNTFQDLYGVLDFFTGGDDHNAGSVATMRDGTMKRRPTVKRKGDLAAQWIAEQGKLWAEKVLRREDMRLYVWRLLLEWARVCDEDRELLGFVDDLNSSTVGEKVGAAVGAAFSQFSG